MGFDLDNALEAVKEGTKEIAEVSHEKTNEFHNKYVSKYIPDCGKYGEAAKFLAEMAPGVAEYNALKDGNWTDLAIALGVDAVACAAGAFTAGAGYVAVKGAVKGGVKVAAREIAEAGTKKVVKEIAEAGTKKVVKETAEVGAEKIAKEVAEAGTEKFAKEVAEAGTEKAAKEAVEAGAEKTVKETAEATGKEVVERFADGGSYRDIKKISDGEFFEVHHMPSKASSFLDELDGPAIKMDKFDHHKTASWGSSAEAREYRKMQKELIDNGKFREAIDMDIQDIRSKFGNKYDDAIKNVLEYVDKLELEGRI